MNNTAKTTKTSHAVHELQDLLVRLMDSQKGYRSAGELAKSPTLETLFEKRSQQREKFISEIKTCLRESGADTNFEGSTEAKAHRKFMELRSDMGGKDEAILKEVCRGEGLLIDSYEDAIEDTIEDLGNQVTSMERRVEQIRLNLVSKFASLEGTLATMQSQGNFLASQLAGLAPG